MFETKIKTKVYDPEKISPEITTNHRALAAEKLGENIALVRSENASIPVLADDSLDTIGHEYHILSVWKQVPADADQAGE